MKGEKILSAINSKFLSVPFSTIEVSYAKVREYNDFLADLPEVTHMSGDLKNYQRPWVVDKISRYVSSGRLLEVGADKCELADYLQKRGYEVWVIDPYSEIGGGTGVYSRIRRKFRKLRVVKGFLHENETLPLSYFDVIYSCSVLEHIPISQLDSTITKILQCLKPGGLSIHAVDFTVQGRVLENYQLVDAVLKAHGADYTAESVAKMSLADTDTYFLSPIGHYRWRQFLGKSYDEYPFRKVTSLGIVAAKSSQEL